MGDGQQYVVMCTDPDNGKVFYVDSQNKKSSMAPTGYPVRVPLSPLAWNSMMYQDKKDSVEVLTLPFSQTIPTPLISSWPSGPIESYAHTIGFRYQATTPKEVTASMILELRPGGLKAFNLIVGGPVSTPIIPFQTLLGLEGRTAGGPESKFSVKIDPAEISFITNRSISEFVPIADLFRGSLTHAGVAMSWTEGAGVYARFRLAMEQSPATLIMSTKLVLEAAVFEDGYVLPSLGEPVKMAIEKSSSSAIPLWETPVAWHRPLADFSLMTTPGINYYATNGLACTDPQLRWGMSWAVNECKKGKAITTATEWTEYIKNPIPTYPPGPTRHSFVVTFSPDPVFLPQNSGRRLVNTTGQAGESTNVDSFNHPTNTVETNKISVVRKGKIVNIIKPSKRQVAKTVKPTAPPKYCSTPKPQFRLSSSALPSGSSPELVEAATRAFASSVSVRTQCNYNTALNHLEKAEALLGRTFCNPPLESEIAYFVSYLIQKGLSKPTITNYMSGLRYIMMSRGAHSPTPATPLTSQLLSGMINIQKDAVKEATKIRRRPITLNMIILLKHAIATHPTWSPYEKSLRWSVTLLGYWGSFRMGELVSKEKYQFNESTSLLPTDIQFKEGCVAVWVRSPKIYSEGGDVVEVWSVTENTDLDPVAALTCFMKLRHSTHGEAKQIPLFLHEDGSLYHNTELNKDLKSLLDQFPSLSSSTRECWSAHSFRAGLATLLSNLGFSETKIKSWGRWRSSAYRAYAQDQAMRRNTRMELSSLFGLMLKTLK